MAGGSGGSHLRAEPAKRLYAVPNTYSPWIAISSNASRFAVEAREGAKTIEIRIYDAATGKTVSAFAWSHSLTPHAFALSNTGKYLVSLARGEASLVVWNVATRKAKRVRLPEAAKEARWGVFSADAKTLCLLADEPVPVAPGEPAPIATNLVLVRTTTGKVLQRIPTGGAACSRNECFLSPNGALLLAAGPEKKVLLWETATGRPPASWESPSFPEYWAGLSAAFSADGSRLAIFSHVWDTKTWKEIAPPKRHREPQAVAFSSDGASLASIWSDSVTRVSTVADGRVTRTIATDRDVLAKEPGSVRLRPSLDGTARAFVSDEKKSVLDYSLDRDGPPGFLGTGAPSACALARDGRRIAVSAGGRIAVWDYVAKKELAGVPAEKAALALALSKDGSQIAASFEKEVVVYDAGSGKALHRVPRPDAPLRVLGFSPNGRALALGADIWDTRTWKKLVTLPTKGEGALRAVAFSPDSALIAVGAASGRVGVFDADGKALRTLEGHVAPVTCLAWSADGKRLASGSQDTTILCWDVSGL